MSENNNIYNTQLEETVKPKPKNKIILIGVVILIFVLLGVGGWYFLSKGQKTKTKTDTIETKDFERHGKNVSLYSVKNNSNDTDNDIYLNYISDLSDEYERMSQDETYELTKKGQITCIGDNCEIEDYDIINQYVAVYEENSMYLYDYYSDKVVFGPAPVDTEKDNITGAYFGHEGFICENIDDNRNDNNCYGYYTNDNGEANIYTFDKKVYSGLKGSYDEKFSNYFKYGYLPVINYFESEDKYDANFYNVKTAKLDYTYNHVDEIDFVDINNTIYNIVASKVKSDRDDDFSFKLTVYDLENNKLFDNVDDVYIEKSHFIVWNDNKLSVYDNNQKKISESSKYDKLLYVDKEYAAVKNGNQIQLIDIYGKLITTLVTSNDPDLDIATDYQLRTIYNQVGLPMYTKTTNFDKYTSINGLTYIDGLVDDNYFFITVPDKSVNASNLKKEFLPVDDNNPDAVLDSYGYVYYYNFATKTVEREAVAIMSESGGNEIIGYCHNKSTNICTDHDNYGYVGVIR